MYHNGHHVVGRAPFFADHAALADFYEAVDGEYDMLSEKFCSKYGSDKLSFSVLMGLAADKARGAAAPTENKDVFTRGLQAEQELCKLLENMIKTLPTSEGERQLLGNICQASEGRQYKIKQRIK
jgi:DNA-binding ferritin-like protein